MANFCYKCNKKLGMTKFVLKDGFMCIECYNSFNKETKKWLETYKGHLKNVTISDIETRCAADLVAHSDDPEYYFKSTKSFGMVEYDSEHDMLCIIKMEIRGIKFITTKSYLPLKDVYACEMIEDGVSVSNTGLVGGVVGGALFGGVGAVVGTVAGKKSVDKSSQMGVAIYTNNVDVPSVFVQYIASGANKNTQIYRDTVISARELNAFLSSAIKSREVQQQPTGVVASTSNADEIRKYKQLLDDGIITQEEYESKKQQLLGL